MTASFFAQFPQVTYANNTVVDITERVVVRNGLVKNPYVYYPMSLVPYARPDQVAYTAWGNPYLSWILYLTNNIIDPYYDWYLPPDEFDSFISLKYGSIANAMNTIAFYVNNWPDQTDITPAAFEALTANQQPFWAPNYGYYNTPISYSRLQADWYASTNYVLGYTISGNTVPFQFNEPLFISLTPGTSGAAQFKQGNSTQIFVQHISGDAFPDANNGVVLPGQLGESFAIGVNSLGSGNAYVYGTSSGANAVVTSCKFLSNNINEDLVDYYSPVYYYDLESELNSGNRFINVLNPQYQPEFTRVVTGLLQSTNVAVIPAG